MSVSLPASFSVWRAFGYRLSVVCTANVTCTLGQYFSKPFSAALNGTSEKLKTVTVSGPLVQNGLALALAAEAVVVEATATTASADAPATATSFLLSRTR